MAIDIRKLGLQPLVRDEVSDMRSKSKFPDDLAGTHREGLLAYDYLPAEKGKGKKGKDISASFQAKVKILESTAPMAAGRTYSLRFWLGGDNSKYADRDRQSFLAATTGLTVDQVEENFAELDDTIVVDKDAGFTAKKQAIENFYLDVGQKLLDFSEKNGFQPEPGKDPETQIIHVTKTKTKDYPVIEDKVAKIVTKTHRQDYFSPIG